MGQLEDHMRSPRTKPISAFTLIELLVTFACVLLAALTMPSRLRR
jgi:type II secretory pathway pseudopilin PulG